MKSWAIYKNEERELREFVNKVTTGQTIRENNDGGIEARAFEVNIRYMRKSQKLIFHGEQQNLALIKRQYISFTEQIQCQTGGKRTLH